MANPIVQQINAELESLQKELDKFKSNVEYLNGAKVLVKGAIQGLNSAEDNFNEKIIELKSTYASFIKLTDAVIAVIAKIDTVNFPERLNSIEETVKGIITNLEETKKATLEELQKASQIITNADFEGKFKNLEALINKSVESSDKLTQYISKLKLAEKFENSKNQSMKIWKKASQKLKPTPIK
jgi:chromosome segregation ATPase